MPLSQKRSKTAPSAASSVRSIANPISLSRLASCPGTKSHASVTTCSPAIARTARTDPCLILRMASSSLYIVAFRGERGRPTVTSPPVGYSLDTLLVPLDSHRSEEHTSELQSPDH